MKLISNPFLKGLSYFYFSFPISYLFLSAVLFNIPASKLLTLLLSPYYYLFSGLMIMVGYGFLEMKRWVWYLALTVNGLVIYENALLIVRFSESNYRFFVFMFSVLVIGLLTYRIAREVRVPYFLPKIRWWESDSEVRFSIPVVLLLDDERQVNGRILDLSPKGCFVQSSELPEQEEPVSLGFRVFGQLIRCTGQIVWRTESTVTHPKGIGIKFEHMTRKKRRQLRIASERLKKVFSLFRKNQLLSNNQEFARVLAELQESQVDIFPQSNS